MGEELRGTEVGLVLYWQLEEGEGTIVNDKSYSGNDGDIVGCEWTGDGRSEVVYEVWNPTHAYPRAGRYTAGLRVHSEYGKWSFIRSTTVTAIDGKIQGHVKAADLRTPVEGVQLTLTSSHVNPDVLGSIAGEDNTFSTPAATVRVSGRSPMTKAFTVSSIFRWAVIVSLPAKPSTVMNMSLKWLLR